MSRGVHLSENEATLRSDYSVNGKINQKTEWCAHPRGPTLNSKHYKLLSKRTLASISTIKSKEKDKIVQSTPIRPPMSVERIENVQSKPLGDNISRNIQAMEFKGPKPEKSIDKVDGISDGITLLNFNSLNKINQSFVLSRGSKHSESSHSINSNATDDQNSHVKAVKKTSSSSVHSIAPQLSSSSLHPLALQKPEMLGSDQNDASSLNRADSSSTIEYNLLQHQLQTAEEDNEPQEQWTGVFKGKTASGAALKTTGSISSDLVVSQRKPNPHKETETSTPVSCASDKQFRTNSNRSRLVNAECSCVIC